MGKCNKTVDLGSETACSVQSGLNIHCLQQHLYLVPGLKSLHFLKEHLGSCLVI